MKKSYLITGIIIVLALVLVFLLLPGKQEKDAAVLRVGCDAAFAPFEYVDTETGEVVGFDPDLMRAIGEELGMKVEVYNVAWDGIIPGLISGNYDVIASGMTITEERKQTVNFSDPYINAGQVIAVRNDETEIHTPADLAGRKVAVQISTTGHLEAEKIPGIALIKKFNTSPDAFLEMANGGVDAVIIDLAVAAEQIKANPGMYKLAGPPFTTEEYGLALRKSDTELLKKINRALAAIKENGKYDEIYNKYFND
ncbi:MAG TPA: basic amino acid ABC transporter substrate-binding protein [Bacillota bacterium]